MGTQATSAFLHLNPDQWMGGIVGNLHAGIGTVGVAVIVAIVMLGSAAIRISYNNRQRKLVAAAAATD